MDRRGFAVGDAVHLVELQEWFFSDLPNDDVEFLRTRVGKLSVILSFDDYGHAEIELSKPGGCHLLWVDPLRLEKA